MANKAEIWYVCSLNGADYGGLPGPDNLPGMQSRAYREFPIRPVRVKKVTDETILLHDGRRRARQTATRCFEPGLREALFNAQGAVRRHLQDYERKVMRDFAADMYASILSGDVSRQRAIVSTISRKVAEERARFNGWRASVQAFVELAIGARDEGR